ncbi:MAG: MHYT domain-containing protein [Rhizonema sp. PD37]|nr:MHYT domain-containing protein [Rhizonema sp. PD37]
MAIIGSYAVLAFLPSFTQKENDARFTALIMGILMGLTIWTMHFIGMKAFTTTEEIYYDIFITILSILPAALGSGVAFSLLISKTMKPPSKKRLLISSLILASSISLMHYTGMAAMMMHARISYNYFLVILSIVVAFSASYLSLTYFLNLNFLRQVLRQSRIEKHGKIFPAVLMGFTISLMHYIGMMSTNFIPDSTLSKSGELLLNEYHTYALAFYCAFMLILTSLFVSVTVGLQSYVEK